MAQYVLPNHIAPFANMHNTILPGKSIPTGTIGAIVTTTLLYFLTIWLFGCSISNDALLADKLIVSAVGFPHEKLVQVTAGAGAGISTCVCLCL